MSEPPTEGVLITGAARRIGRAIALELAAHGRAIAIHHHHSSEDAATLADELQAMGVRAAPVAADLSDETALAALLDRAEAAIGPITAVVNNASVFEEDDALSADAESWQRHMSINLRAPFVLTQALARKLADATEENPVSGAVVNIIDHRVMNPTPYFTTYTLSKMALWDMTRMLARAMAPTVRVNGVGPGPVLKSTRQSDDDFRRQWSAQPLARPVAPAEIASAVRFLLDAPSVTGQMIAVDSGQHMGWAPPTGEKDIIE